MKRRIKYKKINPKNFLDGYQPTETKMDTSNPPKGGSGVPPKNKDIEKREIDTSSK
ncbi:hypothetical protein GWO43_01610 [candidate division KSB1 bacterium]|nr:hypothetical protein [candidate division KSB1 bacterium]NIS22774.1 hypothetical protein [candidate division KSB1 bacterium]NIT69614.1 hypothetical protein [candidate division KSB1 bacterium]NIU23283.1 hypothetical protein [candidate division KSB1 bacterium]NIU90492.1 hypothetical protein [candidate division KSB1 bacterium]